MKWAIYKILVFLHRLAAKPCLVRTAHCDGVGLHALCGTWMGGTQYEGSRINTITKRLEPLGKPTWVAIVFAPGEAIRVECPSREAAAELLPSLVRTHLGRRLIVPKEW